MLHKSCLSGERCIYHMEWTAHGQFFTAAEAELKATTNLRPWNLLKTTLKSIQ